MALLPDQIDDFVNLTLNLMKTQAWTDLALAYQEYVFASIVTAKNIQERGGPKIAFKIKTKNTGNARNVGWYGADVTKVTDVSIGAEVPWSMQTGNWSYDIYEDVFQSDRETIIRELQLREHDALSDLAELNEINLWTAPTGPADTRPMGIPFWIQKDSTTTPDGAFNGANPAGFAAGCAGVSSTTYPRWRNWTFGYVNPTIDDLVKKIKKSVAFTNFVPPVPHPQLGFGKSDFTVFTTYRVVEPLERLAESRNDNLGQDLAKYVGQVVVGGIPVRWVPYLEANDLTDPVYGVNWAVFRPFVKTGCNMRRNPPKEAARQHTVREVHIDNAMNYICYNRRRLWVGSK